MNSAFDPQIPGISTRSRQSGEHISSSFLLASFSTLPTSSGRSSSLTCSLDTSFKSLAGVRFYLYFLVYLCVMCDKSGKQNYNFALSETVADAKYAHIQSVQCDMHNASHVQCTNASIICLGKCCHRWKRLYLDFTNAHINIVICTGTC